MLTALVSSAMAVLVAAWTAVPGGPSNEAGQLRGFLQRRGDAIADGLLARLRGRPEGDDVVAFCAALAAELRAGSPAPQALITASAGVPAAPRARAAALLGEPVAPALSADAAAVGSTALAGVAACWQAACESGAALSDGLDRVAALARAERRVAADLASETAAPKATARILGLLPLLGLLLGELLGAHPLQWLIGSPAGWLCLAGGALFLAAGNAWARRILQQAMPQDAGLR